MPVTVNVARSAEEAEKQARGERIGMAAEDDDELEVGRCPSMGSCRNNRPSCSAVRGLNDSSFRRVDAHGVNAGKMTLVLNVSRRVRMRPARHHSIDASLYRPAVRPLAGRQPCTYAGVPGPEALIELRTAKTVRRLIPNPALAVGEAYMDGTLVPVGCSIYDLLDVLSPNATAETSPAI